MKYVPGYLRLHKKGELHSRVRQLRKLLEECRLCERRCGVNRLSGETGYCGAGDTLEVASSCIHKGEEPVLTGNIGVGNVFLGRCNMKCIFCQNHVISQPSENESSSWSCSTHELAERLLVFQRLGCPSAGFVSPTPWVPWILEAVCTAAEKGFNLPIIYNTNGYDSIELLRLLDGAVDIYLPDFKYWDDDSGIIYSDTPDYPETARAAITEMHRQTGILQTDSAGAAVKGMIIRLLVLPGGISGTGNVLRYIAEELNTDVFISLMSQYYPAHKADEYSPLDRKLELKEYLIASNLLDKLGFENGWVQDPVTSPDNYRPGIEFDI